MGQMKVTVRIFGDLIPLLGRTQTVEAREGSRVEALVRKVSSQAGETRPGYIGSHKIRGKTLVILVNGRNISTLNGLDTILKDGDTVILLPPFAGG
jgi:MoaD family protein